MTRQTPPFSQLVLILEMVRIKGGTCNHNNNDDDDHGDKQNAERWRLGPAK